MIDTLIAMVLFEVHTIDGRSVFINPEQVVSMAHPNSDKALFVEGIQCVITLSDRKFISVRETCDEVQMQMQAGGAPLAGSGK